MRLLFFYNIYCKDKTIHNNDYDIITMYLDKVLEIALVFAQHTRAAVYAVVRMRRRQAQTVA